ncbi:DUF2478 domain-containing protein [Algihabitans albus]|uniref:DUF2478 domain-containing protein n=1 Tax=Algihabitans albus TaxID=2164067 RepID=UPI000E5CCDD5|nr:DUF2478 domain-containing protein [Algihabitans albus]
MIGAPLATLVYAPNDGKSDLLADFAGRRRAEGVVVDGVVIETLWSQPGTKSGLQLRALKADRATPLTQPYREGIVVGRWHLLPDGVATMARILERAAASSTDLLIVDKFGPLEGRGLGMASALRKALAKPVPMVVAVRHEFLPAWRSFVADAAPTRLETLTELPPDEAALNAWWAATACA